MVTMRGIGCWTMTRTLAIRPDTLLKALVRACKEHGDRLDAETDALIRRGDAKAVRQPWGSSTTASALKDPHPTIY